MLPSEVPGLSEVKEPLQSFLLSCNPEAITFTDRSSTTEGVELLEKFGVTVLRSGSHAWGYVDFQDNGKILKTMSDGYKAIRSAA